MPSISFRFRARTQSQILDLDNAPSLSVGGIKARDAREKIAAAVGTPADEIEIYFGAERIHEEEVIPYFSCVEVERCAPVKRTGGGGGGGIGGGRGGGPGATRQPEYMISASGEAYRVGRGGMIISANRGYQGRGGMNNADAQQQSAEVITAEGDGEFKLLQQRMADGVESVSVETTTRGRGRGRGGAMGAGGMGDGPKGPPPPGYVCHNCGNKGHHIEDCPKPRTNTGIKRVAPPDGIAESMLVPCSEDDPARCVTRDGRFVKRVVASDLFVEVSTVGLVGNNSGGDMATTSEAHVADVLRQVVGGGGTPPAEGGADAAASADDSAAAPTSLEAANLLCYQCKKLLEKAVELPSCGCKVRFCSAGDCIDKYIESKEDEAVCPKCDEMFFLDDLDEIPTVREQVETVRQLLKKRARE